MALNACGGHTATPLTPTLQNVGASNAGPQIGGLQDAQSLAGQYDTPSFDASPLAIKSATTTVPKHVLVGAYIWGFAGTPKSVPLSEIAPYVTWAETDEASAQTLRNAGIKVFIYTNFWINTAKDNPNVGYIDLKPGGAHAAAEAKACNGAPVRTTRYDNGYEADARSPSALGHAMVLVNYRIAEYGHHYDAIFPDDTASLPVLPCNFNEATYITATNKVDAGLKIPTLINALGVGDAAQRVTLTEPSNVFGAMCEGLGCYAGWHFVNGVKTDLAVTGGQWENEEQAEVLMVQRHKIFWDYARAIGNPVTEIGLRKYIIASFLLTYDPSYAMITTYFYSPRGFTTQPETGLVPMNPLTTASSIAGYRRSTGVYEREFAHCYFRGVLINRCAVVVNSGSGTVGVPSGYSHSMTLLGGSIIDGGKVGFTGPAVRSLGPAGGAVLFP